MQIQIKQKEITDAVTDYIQRQGFNLEGKKVTVSFTAGRKEGGIYADIYINEDAPADEESHAVPVKPKATVVTRDVAAPSDTQPVEDVPPEAGGETKTNSLFS